MNRDSASEADKGAVEEAIKLWIKHFQTSLFSGISEQQIAKLMSPIARDDAWIHYGGSGRRSHFYLIDDYLQARFDLDDRGLVLSYTVYESRGGWLKGPDGVLLWGYPSRDAELLLP